jgi:hypothetical protein
MESKMILYKVCRGTIEVLSVVRETKTGWREHNNGFINRSEMRKFFRIDDCYYTTSITEAKEWCSRMIDYIHHIIQVNHVVMDDIEMWERDGSNESELPEGRAVISKSPF